MTEKQALRKARKVLGKNAAITHSGEVKNERGETLLGAYRVGIASSYSFEIKGSGETWEKAFENVESRLKYV